MMERMGMALGRGRTGGGGKREEHAPEPQNMPQAANPHLLFSLAGTTR